MVNSFLGLSEISKGEEEVDYGTEYGDGNGIC
jgi:hypothetical protein